jgi:phosphonate transport system permease protein
MTMLATNPRGMLALRPEAALRHAALLRPSLTRRAVAMAVTIGLFGGLIASMAYLGFSASRIITGLGRIGGIVAWMVPPDPQSWVNAMFYLHALGETLAIAFIGTLVAAVLAFPLSFIAARNVVANRIMHILSRRIFDTIRGVDSLIWALIWINVVGLGPFAGALAIVTSDIGALGKLFSEAIETADARPVDGVVSCGGGRLAAIRFGLLPQLLPVVLSQLLFFFESNTRSATVLGIVGAGGIGLPLSEMIRTDEWHQVSFIVVLLLVTVAVITWLSGKVRFAIIGARPV